MNDLIPTGTVRYEHCDIHNHEVRVLSGYVGDDFVSVVEEKGGVYSAVVGYKSFYPDGISYSWDNHEYSGSKEEVLRWIKSMLDGR